MTEKVKALSQSTVTLTTLQELESHAMAAWVLWPTDPLWDLVDSTWFSGAAWRQVWDWVSTHRTVKPADWLVRLLQDNVTQGLACMEAVNHWRDVVSFPDTILPTLRQVREYRRVQAILDAGLQLDPTERDPAEWTVQALEAELAQRQGVDHFGHTAAEGVTELTAEMLEIDTGSSTRQLWTGFPHLDSHLFGLWPEDLLVIGGRPATGKTTLALNMVRHLLVRQHKAVGYISLEMSETALHAAWLAQALRVPVSEILSPQTEAVRTRYQEQLTQHYRWPLMLWTENASLDQIRAMARQWRRAGKLDILFVDYLQLIERPSKTTANETEQLAQISRGLKSLAKDLQIPIVAISSGNRQKDQRASGTPRLSDLRGSGQIEHDGTKVLFTYDPAQDEMPSGPLTAETMVTVRVRVAKVRQGGHTGDVDLALWPATQRMEAITHRREEDHP